MTDVGADKAPGEILAPPREDAAVVIAAAMWRQVQRRGLAVDDTDVDVVREVWILGPDGIASDLETAAFSALEEAPAVTSGEGGEHRTRLLTSGRSAHPDDRVRWERVRQAAVDAARVAGELAAREARLPVRLADVADVERRRRLLEQVGEVFGEDW